MSMCELDRLKCIQAVIDGGLQARAAAEQNHLSARQIRRLRQRYRHEGPVKRESPRATTPVTATA
jgi:transposase